MHQSASQPASQPTAHRPRRILPGKIRVVFAGRPCVCKLVLIFVPILECICEMFRPRPHKSDLLKCFFDPYKVSGLRRGVALKSNTSLVAFKYKSISCFRCKTREKLWNGFYFRRLRTAFVQSLSLQAEDSHTECHAVSVVFSDLFFALTDKQTAVLPPLPRPQQNSTFFLHLSSCT